MIKFNNSNINSISGSDCSAYSDRLAVAHDRIWNGTGRGNDFLGWRDLPACYDREEFLRIKNAAERIRASSDILLVIGIGGSYLGARACIEYLKTPYHNNLGGCEVYFIGNSFSGKELATVLYLCEGKDVSVNVISKSGTTTESAVAFRIMREYMASRYTKEEQRDRIFATTDAKRGSLKALANEEGWECFVIPDDVGGRFSVLTAVGLLPAAVAGVDIDALMCGAAEERSSIIEAGLGNDAYKYAVLRNLMLERGKSVELLVSYDPDFRFMGEWFKQLFGESEGKESKGIFPASAIYSSDLHSLGQYVQDGQRILFETVCVATEADSGDIAVPFDEANGDGLNFLADMHMDGINKKAMLGTMLAHRDGGCDTAFIEFPRRDERSLGALIYFFFIACAASGYILDVNPFDQPGVEEYKKNMFALLGKPGYEERLAEIEKKTKA